MASGRLLCSLVARLFGVGEGGNGQWEGGLRGESGPGGGAWGVADTATKSYVFRSLTWASLVLYLLNNRQNRGDP